MNIYDRFRSTGITSSLQNIVSEHLAAAMLLPVGDDDIGGVGVGTQRRRACLTLYSNLLWSSLCMR